MKFVDLIKRLELPFAYDHFAENEEPRVPYLTYLFSESDNFNADNKVYQELTKIELVLYVDKKDIELERKISDLLSENDIPFNKRETFNNESKLYEVVYSFEMLVDSEIL